MEKYRVTMLNSMADPDLERALDCHVAWGLHVLDLKDSIFGKSVETLTVAEAERAAGMIRARGLTVWCLSTQMFFAEVEAGEAVFRQRYVDRLDDFLKVAAVLRPTYVRLLAAKTARRQEISDSIDYLADSHPWLMRLYRETVDRIAAAGFEATIENEAHMCILSTPGEITDFFAAMDRRDRVCLTWDVQNLWQMGTFPTLTVYQTLKPFIGYYHLKGGRDDGGTRKLELASSLEEASWPAADITRRVIRDGVSSVICLNTSHGKLREGASYADMTRRDLAFTRRLIAESQP